MSLRIVIVSDTHTLHEQIGPLRGDVLIHCGDMCNGFAPDSADLHRIDDWFARQEFELILCTGGNHDFVLEERNESERRVFQHAVCLLGEAIEFGGINFFAAPWVPKLEGWAFFQADDELSEKWGEIPDDTNVLITHTPPLGIRDLNQAKKAQGCPLLRQRLEELASLQLHAFGHIHESYGAEDIGGVQFVNAALQSGDSLRSPISIEL